MGGGVCVRGGGVCVRRGGGDVNGRRGVREEGRRGECV